MKKPFYRRGWFLALVLLVVFSMGYGAGTSVESPSVPASVQATTTEEAAAAAKQIDIDALKAQLTTQSTTQQETPDSSALYVGSINSNKYHYPSCGHAKKIKAYNEVWFSTVTEAKTSGYVRCSVCKPPAA